MITTLTSLSLGSLLPLIGLFLLKKILKHMFLG